MAPNCRSAVDELSGRCRRIVGANGLDDAEGDTPGLTAPRTWRGAARERGDTESEECALGGLLCENFEREELEAGL